VILPVGDAPNPKGATPVTWVLIALNVAVFVLVSLPLEGRRPDFRDPVFAEYVEVISQALDGRVSPRELAAQASAYDIFVFEHGYRPAAPRLGDLFFSMFLHGGFLHLAGNMLFLWIYGDNVERRLGSLGFAGWYLVTGAAATLFHALFASGSEIPLVGASGAISGVLGFYFVWFPRNVVRLLFLLPPFLMNVFEVPARLVLGIYVVADNLLPFLFAGGGGVAHGAHIGGFLAGAAVAWWQDRRLSAGPVPAPAPEEPRPAGPLTALEAVSFAHRLRESGQADAALSLLRRVVREVRKGEGLAEACLLAGLILLHDKHEATAAYQYLLTSLELDPPPEVASAAVAALREIESLQKRRIGHLRARREWRG
jgi:membrane associated rhomboid family serine protease